MAKILIVSHSPYSTTGYGRVVRGLAGSLNANGHEIVCLGAGSKPEKALLPYPVIQWNKMTGKDIAAALTSQRPDVLLTIGDPWMFEAVPAMAERQSTVWLAYYPIDGYPLPMDWKRWAQAVDVPVVFSKFARDVVQAATGKAPELIYHGVNTRSFCPDDRQKAKELAKVAGHFVVGTVARNQMRKNIPALIKAFAKFANGKDDALLYLHTQLQGEFDIAELVRTHGVVEKTRITGEIANDKGVPDQLLATVYRAMDIFVLPTMAEGFGLPIMECQACGTPALVTDFSACPELVPDPIQRLKVKVTLTMNRNFEQAIVDVDDIVEKLRVLYDDRERLKLLGERCHQFAQSFEWSIAYKQFSDLIASAQFQTIAAQRRKHVASAKTANYAGPFSQQPIDSTGARRTGSTKVEASSKPAEPFEEVEQMHADAVARLKAGKAGEAVQLLRRIVEMRPRNPEFQNQLAVALQTDGKLDEAIDCYLASVKLWPDRHQVWTNLARAQLIARNLSGAKAACFEALKLAPASAAAHDVRGMILKEEGDFPAAKLAFQGALALMPQCGPAKVHLAELADGSDSLDTAAGRLSLALTEANARLALDAAIKALTPYPGGHEGRGIVIVGGGVRYFPCAWICIRMLRECGCMLPIELWYLGNDEMTPQMRDLVSNYSVVCVDGGELAVQHGLDRLGGWELKPFAIMHSRFREVLLLDADNFPLVDPQFLFDAPQYAETGAAFWADYGKLKPDDKIWELTGVSYREEPAFESGQILIDKSRCWEPLSLTMWFNQKSGFWYRYLFGDKDTFHIAWRKLGRSYAMPIRGIENLPYAMAQHDFEGRRIFQHRNRAKWVLSGWNPKMEGFDREDRGFAFLEELRGLSHLENPDYNLAATEQLQRAWKHYAEPGYEGEGFLSTAVKEVAEWKWVGRVARQTTGYIPDSHTIWVVREAIQALPGLAELHAILGTTLGAMGRHGEALALFRVASQLCPALPGLKDNLEIAIAYTNDNKRETVLAVSTTIGTAFR